MRAHNNQKNENIYGRKLSIPRPNNNNLNYKESKIIQLPRSKSGKVFISSEGNNNKENINLNFDYGNNFEKLLNKPSAINNCKYFNKQPQNKVNQKQKIIKENKNKLNKGNSPYCLGAKINFKFENNQKIKDKPIKITAQNKNRNNNCNNDLQFLNFKERPNSSDKQKDEINKKIKNENYNQNQNNYNDKQMNFSDLIYKENNPKTINNKNFDFDLNKGMNNLIGKGKNLDYNLNFNEKMEVNEQLNEMQKQNNEKYEVIIKEKENEINFLKQHLNEIKTNN